MVLPYVAYIISKTGVSCFFARVGDQNSPVIDCRLYLEHIANDISAKVQKTPAQNIDIKTEVLFFNPVDALINYADQIKAELVIIGSRGASNQARWPLGNVAQKILRISKIPVLVVKRSPQDVADVSGPLIKKILLPLDGSKLSETAIPHAATMAGWTESELVLTQVIQHVEVPSGSPATGITWHVGDYEIYLRSQADNYLGKIAGSLKDTVKNVTSTVLTGSPAEQIIDYSEKSGVDLIVMSSHGRSGVGRWFFGSVTEKILNGGDTPVLVIRQPAD